MSPTPPDVQPFPPLVSTLLQSAGQHLGTLAAGALASYGLVQGSQSTEVIDLVTSVLIGGAGLAWAFVMHRIHAQKALVVAQSAAITGVVPK